MQKKLPSKLSNLNYLQASISSLDKEWREFLLTNCYEELLSIDAKLTSVAKTNIIYPPQDLIFNALRLTSLSNTKVVIIGQDPLAYSAMLMAGIDGIINKIDPGKSSDRNLYEFSKEELSKIPQVCCSLDEALYNLDKDREFLKRGDVFSDEWIDAFIELKQQEIDKYRMTSHPIEYEMYYSL